MKPKRFQTDIDQIVKSKIYATFGNVKKFCNELKIRSDPIIFCEGKNRKKCFDNWCNEKYSGHGKASCKNDLNLILSNSTLNKKIRNAHFMHCS